MSNQEPDNPSSLHVERREEIARIIDERIMLDPTADPEWKDEIRAKADRILHLEGDQTSSRSPWLDAAMLERCARAMCKEIGLHADDWDEIDGERTYVWQRETSAAAACLFAAASPPVSVPLDEGSANASQAGTREPIALAPTDAEPSAAFQARVEPWMRECFGDVIPFDKVERGDRFLEEAFELLQSGGYDQARVAQLRDYVWGRPVGEAAQEVGGVMVTLAAYCLAFGLDMHVSGETELARIWTKVPQIRAKQAAKPPGIALPIGASPAEGAWRPIESAPRDGTAIILLTADGPHEGRWGEGYQGDHEVEPMPPAWTCTALGSYDDPRLLPEAWQPMPSPPGEAQSQPILASNGQSNAETSGKED